MRLSRNLASMNIYRSYKKNLSKYSTSMERISSGTRINKAKDDPNNLAESERMRLEVRSYGMASRNVQDSISMLQTTESGLENIQNSLNRVRELIIKSKGTTSDSDKDIIKSEIDEILESVDELAKNTEFNGKSLIRGEIEKVETMIGGNVGEKVTIPTTDVTLYGLGLSAGGIGRIDLNDVDGALELVDSASDKVISFISKCGSVESRLESVYDRTIELKDRVTGIESKVRDADVAMEMVQLSKNMMLIDASNTLMAQTNKFPQDILRILENVRSR